MSIKNIFPPLPSEYREQNEGKKSNIDIIKREFKKIKKVLPSIEKLAKQYSYLDDYKILVISNSTEPIIIMNEEEFKKLEERVIGEKE